ncbi:MAG: NfeD family protein [Syntrophomonadaceae bacterium]|nr:NfeD family protein [Syntrophomonadaceae bacterium]
MSSLQWVIIAVVAGVIEIFSLGLWFLWLAISAVIVALAAQLGLLTSLDTQLLTFALLTLIFVIFTRPLVLKFFKTHDTASNVEALIGQHGMVTSRITPMHFGQVKVNGEIWTASAREEIETDTRIEVTGIDGVKLLVKPAD